jgi:hypothetical protein
METVLRGVKHRRLIGTGTQIGRRVVVARHWLSNTFPLGTLKAMIADAEWMDADLLRLGLLR